MLRNIWRVRELLFVLVRRDLIVRYQSSVLGFLWSFVKPLALVAIFFVAFGQILRISPASQQVPFALHLLVGIMVWTFFSRSLGEGHYSVLSHASLIKKIKLPVEVFPAVTVAGNLINFLLGMVVVYPIALFVMARTPNYSLGATDICLQLLALAALTVLTAFLSFAMALIVSALNVFYRDVESLSEVALQAWFYATPIVYPASLLYESPHNFFGPNGRAPAWLEYLYWLNPMAGITAAFRRVLLYRKTPEIPGLNAGGLEIPDEVPMLYLGFSIAGTIILYIVAAMLFRHYSRSFSDEV